MRTVVSPQVTPCVPPDADVRERAVDVRNSVIVQAPAGSGKTALLIHRYLALLARARQPEEVVVITFTRKAVEELKTRVLQALGSSASSDATPYQHTLAALAQQVRQRAGQLSWNLDADPSRLAIHTLDGLCARIARRMPWLAGMGGGLGVEPYPRELYIRASNALLAHLDGEPRDAAALEAVIRHVDGDLPAVLSLLQDMLARREQWLGLLASGYVAPDALRDYLHRTLADAASQAVDVARARLPDDCMADLTALMGTLGRLHPPDSEFASLASWHPEPGGQVGEFECWQALARALLLASGKGFQKRGPAAPALAPADRDEARAIRARARPLLERFAAQPGLADALAVLASFPPRVYDDPEWALMQALFHTLRLAVAELTVAFGDTARADFVELAAAAIAALGSPEQPTDLALRLDYRVNHLLLDEFQDTSVTHHRFLDALCAGFVAGDGRTLFLVGDPMQSIYRFRQAEVGQFLHCMTGRMGSHPLQALRLTANFRSRPALVEWFNSSFQHAFAASNDPARGAVAFNPSTAIRCAAAGAGVQVHGFTEDDGQAQAARVAELIASLKAQDGSASIAVLTRSRTHMAPVIAALEQKGLRYRGVDLKPLAEVQVVRDLHALTRAVLHPMDRVAWLAVLRAPWCGLRLADLLTLLGHDLESPVFTCLGDGALRSRLDHDARQRLARVVDALGPVLADDEARPLKRRVEAAWLRLGAPACYGEAQLRDAEAYLELLGELGPEPARLAELERRLCDLYAAPLAGPADVELMTMHRAKGLEFEHVILPMLERTPRAEASRLLLWTELSLSGGARLALAARPPPGGDKRRYDYVRGIEADKAGNETSRLLYVACTRARQSLHLLGSVSLDGAGAPERPDPRSLLHRVWRAVGPCFAAQLQGVAAQSPSATAGAVGIPRPLLRRVPAPWHRPSPAPGAAIPGAQPPGAGTDDVEYDWAGRVVRHVGSVVHAMLARVAGEGPEAWSRERVRAHAGHYRRQLEALGVEREQLDSAAQRVCLALERTLADPTGQWILDPSHADAASELGLSGWLQGRLVHVFIDRSFVDRDAVRWIIDFKTGEHEGAGLDAFLGREQERYGAQLTRYARLMAQLDSRPIRVGLYFPLMTAWRWWTADAAT